VSDRVLLRDGMDTLTPIQSRTSPSGGRGTPPLRWRPEPRCNSARARRPPSRCRRWPAVRVAVVTSGAAAMARTVAMATPRISPPLARSFLVLGLEGERHMWARFGPNASPPSLCPSWPTGLRDPSSIDASRLSASRRGSPPPGSRNPHGRPRGAPFPRRPGSTRSTGGGGSPCSSCRGRRPWTIRRPRGWSPAW
jgi:hypothetical protein